MKKMTLVVLIAVAVVGCRGILGPTLGERFRPERDGYVLDKRDEGRLAGPYKIIERVTAVKMIILRHGMRSELLLRGCRGLGGEYDNIVKGSYPEDLGAYLLKSTIVELSSNQVAAVVYSPANQVYVGMPKGFENLSYIMPQMVHISNGELLVDHSDTNYPLYRVFLEAEHAARKHKKGYWTTRAEPPQ